MKKLLLSLAVIVSLASVAGAYTETLPPAVGVGNVMVSNGYDWSLSSGTTAPPIQLPLKTIAALQLLQPVGLGQVVFCSNCVHNPVCVSSGTGVGAWVTVSSAPVSNFCN